MWVNAFFPVTCGETMLGRTVEERSTERDIELESSRTELLAPDRELGNSSKRWDDGRACQELLHAGAVGNLSCAPAQQKSIENANYIKIFRNYLKGRIHVCTTEERRDH